MKSQNNNLNSDITHISVKYVEINADHAGRRIDNYLFSALQDVPRSRIYQMLRKGEVRVNSKRVKQGYRLQEGEKLRIPPVSHKSDINPELPRQYLLDIINKSIIYDDDNLMVINKPSGIVVRGGTGRSFGVIEILRILQKDKIGTLQLAHRLDRDTSGILLISKNMKFLTFLHECFKNRQIKKSYKALLKGQLDKDMLTVRNSLARNIIRGGERLSSIADEGKQAETVFKKIKLINDSTLVDVNIKTGRTHQIRVHAESISHPIAGDEKYGNKIFNKKMKNSGLKRLFLHAESITIPAYKGKKLFAINAPLADELSLFLKSYSTINA